MAKKKLESQLIHQDQSFEGTPLMDYMTSVVKEVKDVKDETTSKFSKLKRKLHNINVKYVYDSLPEDKNDPNYKTILGQIPRYAHDGDIGMDIVATSMEYDMENDRYIYHTGYYCEAGKGDGCLVMPRSSNTKTECYMPHSIGLIDTFTYRGELLVVYKHRTSFQTRMVQLMLSTWVAMPWYKKLFTNYNKWCNKNRLYAATVVKEDVINDAPYQVGDKIAQLVWMKFPEVNMKRLKSRDQLSETVRGEGGFGSTGK